MFSWTTGTKTVYAKIKEVVQISDNYTYLHYYTDTTLIGGYCPLVKIDHIKKRIYFMTMESVEKDFLYPEFITNGTKIKFDTLEAYY